MFSSQSACQVSAVALTRACVVVLCLVYTVMLHGWCYLKKETGPFVRIQELEPETDNGDDGNMSDVGEGPDQVIRVIHSLEK